MVGDLSTAIDRYLITFEDVLTINHPTVELGLCAAKTHRRQLFDIVGYFEEPFATRKKVRLEIGTQAVGDDGNIVLLGNAVQLADLFAV